MSTEVNDTGAIQEELRRLFESLSDPKLDRFHKRVAAFLGEEGYGKGAMWGYISGRTKKIPADFLAAVCRAFQVNPRWLLWGEEPYELQDPSDVERRMLFVRKVVEGEVSTSTLEAALAAAQEAEEVDVAARAAEAARKAVQETKNEKPGSDGG